MHGSPLPTEGEAGAATGGCSVDPIAGGRLAPGTTRCAASRASPPLARMWSRSHAAGRGSRCPGDRLSSHDPMASELESIPQRPNDADPIRRWAAPASGRAYERDRWSHAGRRARDPRLVASIVAGLELPPAERVLDVPCGTGRLAPVLERNRPYVGLDASSTMLAEASTPSHRRLLRGDAARLPFTDRSFGLVVCCRLLHHLRDGEDLERVVAELVRVSSRFVLASFWDARSLESLRRRLPFVRRPRHRVARRRAELERAVELAGARALGWHSSLPGLSQQVWMLAERSATRGDAS